MNAAEAAAAVVAADAAKSAELSGRRVGRYVVEKELGAGGMGVVYLAHDPELDRRVALKLLRAGSGGTAGRTRLLREAQGMARVSHPNVVTVFDVGTHGDEVFLAMELVEGTTVAEWLEKKKRTWREVLAVFVAAGDGLAAAHRKGLVHRDFKPANVLIDAEGRARVADFGLVTTRAAAMAALELEPPPAPPGPPRAPPRSTPMETPLTEAGYQPGTPAYMAPEEFLGRPPDERVDQFSFCVSLYEGLYGERPFAGRADPTKALELRPPPRGSDVPAWVRSRLLRGLRVRPDERYPSMDALLAALRNDPVRRAVRAAAAVGLGLAVIAAGIGVWSFRRAHDPCTDPTGKLAGVWDDATRKKLHDGFLASKGANAPALADLVSEQLDRTTKAWVQVRTDACDATREQKTESEAALALKLECLDHQLDDFRSAVELLSSPEAGLVTRSAAAVEALPMASDCADASTLSIVAAPPPALAAKVQDLRRRLFRARVTAGLLPFDKGDAAVAQLVKEADELGYPPVAAEANYVRGLVATEYFKHEEAMGPSARAVELAQRNRQDRLAARAAALWVGMLAKNGAPKEQRNAALAQAKALNDRVGGDPFATAALERILAFANPEDEQDTGLSHARRALELSIQLFGEQSRRALSDRTNVASNLDGIGRYAEAQKEYEKVIDTTERIYGPEAPKLSLPLVDRSWDLTFMGNPEEAIRECDRAEAIGRKSAPTVLTAVAAAIAARSLAALGRHDESRQRLAAAIALGTELKLVETPDYFYARMFTSEAARLNGDVDQAVAEYREADRLAHKILEANDYNWVQIDRAGGLALLAARQPQEAAPLLRRALELIKLRPTYPGWEDELGKALAEAEGAPPSKPTPQAKR